ncbi:FAD-dependent monooxygenase [Actinoplanes auranticolor]|uniref:FAD-dependent oxidoreductase n=1 Tax=Actinoplanes auranticolor TaxID=47988 RepID=A0A919S8I2_9ACTN|nr:FAD-dependent monooxygenase [Actinoplanes auranticolor]GIM66986.1 FAD-dependent oxidoreductase [Actinoplanes auranticolor]
MTAPVLRTSVLVVGAGVAGSVLALELARHQVRSTVVERASRPPRDPALALVRGRSMELLRRLGVAGDIRRHGIDPDLSADVIWSRGLDQPPVLVSQVPSANQVRDRYAAVHDGSDLVEPYLLLPGAELAGRLRAAARDHPLIDLREGWTFTDLRLEPDGTVATVLAAGNGVRHVVEADHLAGCDGARSTVRRCLGIPMEHLGAPAPHYTVHFRCPDLTGRSDRPSTIIAAGITLTWHGDRDFWIAHLPLGPDESAEVDPAHLVRDRLGLRTDTVDVLAVDQWDGALGVARTYRRGTAYLAGEAAHCFDPAGGNADICIGDAVDLGWKLAASINGWAGPGLLASYDSDRRRCALLDRELLARTYETRRRFSRLAAAGASRQFLADVLRQEPPQIETTGTGPAGGGQFLDQLGPQFTLVDCTDDGSGRALTAVARAHGVPMTYLPVAGRADRGLWERRLTLVRPDQHVAWRGDEQPADWAAVLDVATGHRSEDRVNT